MATKLRIDLGYRPHRFQRQIHASQERFACVVAHRRFGKTICGVMELIHRAVQYRGGDGRFAYVAPYLKQAKQVAWDYLQRFALPLPGAEKNESDLSITLANGSRIRLYGADNADALRGLYFDYILIDEVADMRPNVWGEIIRPALADRRGGAMFIGTPKGINLFSEIWEHAQTDSDWYAAMYRADETDILPADELEQARRSMSENQYRQEFLCDFSASADNVLITIDEISAAAQRAHDPKDIDFAPIILGVDVARYGDDRSAIQRRQGLQAYDPIIMQGWNNMELAARVASEIERHKPDAVFIDAGRGEGVIDRLRQLGHRVQAVDFGGKPGNERYRNKRAEMWDTLAEWIKAGGAIPNHTELKSDLSAPTYSLANAAGKFELEPKDKMRERGLRSPDLADALALTFALPVRRQDDRRTEFADTEYAIFD